jgi:hypothetical protein
VAKKKKKLTVAEANRVYFIILANSRGSFSMFSGGAVAILFILAMVTLVLNSLRGYRGYEVMSCLVGVNLAIIGSLVVCLILWMFRSLIYRIQVFSSAVMAGMAVSLVYTLCLMVVGVTTLVQARGKPFNAMLFNVVGVCAAALVVGSTVVHVLMLRHRLRVGHSEDRTMGNIGAVSASKRSKTFWIIAGLVVVVPNILTLGQYLLYTLGASGLIFFACVMPSLPVEYAYLAYLKSKDRDYWEERPRRTSKKERRRIAKKVTAWASAIIATIGLLWALAKYLPMWL